jgi:hypothetical protein
MKCEDNVTKVVMIAVIVLAIFMIPTTTTAQTAMEQQCMTAVQGKVAWNQAGSTSWSPKDLRNLCQGTTNPTATIICFQREIRSHNSMDKGIKACPAGIAAPTAGPEIMITEIIKWPGAARDIDAKNGQTWIIGTVAVGNDYEILKLAGSSWTKVEGIARRIAVDNSGNPWIVNSAGVISRRVNNVWKPMPGPNGGTPVDIAISNRDEVWITMNDGAVARWTGSAWTTLIALNAKQVIYTPNPDQFLIVDQSGKKFVRESPTSWVTGKDTTGLSDLYIEFAVDQNARRDDTIWGIDSSFNIWVLGTKRIKSSGIATNPSPVVPRTNPSNPSPVVPPTNSRPVVPPANPGSVAPRSNATPEAERTITFKNEAGYVAKLTVVYFMTETVGGAQMPMAKSLSTSAISMGTSKSLVIPRNTAKGMPIRVVIEGIGTTKGKVLETTVAEGFNGTLCFKSWGTIFDAKGGACQ